jgi:WD40 repeat protein
MGNCLTKTGEPRECRHERLNEHSDKYFQNVEARNSIGPKERWWRRVFKRNGEQREEYPLPTMNTDPYPMSETEDDKSKLGLAIPFDESTASLMSPSKKNRRGRKRLKADGQVDGWQVKRKGNALQLRLAKNRFLQLAATSDILSPITLDSGVRSTRRSFNPLESPKMNEELNMNFDDSMCTGMIWVEVARTVNVSAVAMSRTSVRDANHPLLLAVGSEDGVVTLTEIIDAHQPGQLGQDDQSSVGSSFRKFGETLEFQAAGRIRSIDFSPDGKYMAIGGDSCAAVVIKVVIDPATGALQDMQAVQQVERVDRIYAVQYSPDSSSLAIGGFDGEVAIVAMDKLLSPESDVSPVEVPRSGLILCLDWSPDGSWLAIGGSDKTCAIVDSSYNLVHETVRSTAIQTMKWNHDGTCLALGDREVAILEAGTFEVKCEICYTPESPGSNTSRYRISSLCWSPDGSFLAVGGSDGICLVVETNGYALVHEIRRSGNISSLAWGQLRMPNGEFRRYLAVSDEGCNVALLKAGSEYEGSVSESDDVSSTASSSYFSAASDWVLREDCFRDMEESTQDLPSGITPQGNITAVAFSRSNKSKSSSYLAYAADDCSLTIMTTRDWKAVFVSAGYAGTVIVPK